MMALLALVAGCSSTARRIRDRQDVFAGLDAATQQKIRAGQIDVGYTPEMVYLAMGNPAQKLGPPTDGADMVWIYHRTPPTAFNEVIQAGYRRRIVYDPVRGGDTIVMERIDPKAFPNLVPHSLRLTFRAGRLASIERVEEL
jgi:hypothetical protein